MTWWSSNAPGFTEDLCRELHDLGVRAVGSDDPTCDMAWVDAEPTAGFGHLEYFLPKDIYILENLEALGGLRPVVFFAALPLKIATGRAAATPRGLRAPSRSPGSRPRAGPRPRRRRATPR